MNRARVVAWRRNESRRTVRGGMIEGDGGRMEPEKRRKWPLLDPQFGVWGVRDYYTLLEEMAREGAKINAGYILMILTAALLATGGLLINSAAVIIGAMCVAPFLSPSRSVCLGGLFGDRNIFWGGLLKQTFGLFFVGTTSAYLITVALHHWLPGVEVTSEVLLRAMPTTKDVVLTVLIAIGAGAAASLALTADPRIVAKPWGQVIDAVIGVEIAISLLPPAAVIGIGFALERPEISLNAFWLLIVNVVCLDFVGSTLMMVLCGMHPRYVAVEKSIRKSVRETIQGALPEGTAAVTASVALLSENTADVCATVQYPAASPVPDDLAETVAREIHQQTGYQSKFVVDMIPSQTYSLLPVEDVVNVKERWYQPTVFKL